jgi:hypothetical protein
MNELGEAGKILPGRQIVWLALKSFKAADSSGVARGLDHLGQVQIVSGDLRKLKLAWDYFVENLPSTSAAPMVWFRDAFRRKLTSVDDLRDNLLRHDMMEEGDPSKTHEHLRKAVEAVLRLRQSRDNQAARESLTRDALGTSPIAADILGGRSQRKDRQGQRQEHVASPSAAAPQTAAPVIIKNSSNPKANAKAIAEPKAKAKAEGKSEGGRAPCRNFHGAEKTRRYGDRCRFMHEPSGAEDRAAIKAMAKAALQAVPTPSPKRSASTDSRKSESAKVVNARAQHRSQGTCRFGDNCRFSHPLHTIASREAVRWG